MLQQCQKVFVATFLGCVSSPLMSVETLTSETKPKYIYCLYYYILCYTALINFTELKCVHDAHHMFYIIPA